MSTWEMTVCTVIGFLGGVVCGMFAARLARGRLGGPAKVSRPTLTLEQREHLLRVITHFQDENKTLPVTPWESERLERERQEIIAPRARGMGGKP